MTNENHQFRYPATTILLGGLIVLTLGILYQDIIFGVPEPGIMMPEPPSQQFVEEFNHIMKGMAAVLAFCIMTLIFYRP